MTPRLLLPAAALALIEADVQAAAPNEACGLLIGTREGAAVHVALAVPSANVAAPETRARRFEIDPALLLRWHRELRGAGQEIVGLYHSHPGGTATLSATDRAEAWTPGLAWLVLALSGREITARAAFLHRAGEEAARFEPMALELVQAEG